MCGGHTSAGVLSRPFGDSIARLGRDWQEGGGGSLPGSRGSAFFVLYRGCVGMPVFRTENLAEPRGLITPVSRPPWGDSLCAVMPYLVQRRYAGQNPVLLSRL